MYFWKVTKLAKDLQDNKVNQKEQFKYAMLNSILIIILIDPHFTTATAAVPDFRESIIFFLLNVWGIYHCHQANQSGDSNDFILRLICLGFPVSIRVLVFFIPIILVSTFALIYVDVALIIFERAILILTSVMQIALYLQLANAIKLASVK